MAEYSEDIGPGQESSSVITPVVKGYSSEQLRTALESEIFQEMHPNFDRPEALLPTDLNQEMVEKIVNTVTSQDIYEKKLQREYNLDFPEREVSGLGKVD